MKTVWNEIEITYEESDDRWHFELRGRKRSAESLAKAKEAIDKEPAAKRKQEFPKFDCYKINYNDDVSVVTVTSLAEESYRGIEFWISANRKRSKETATFLYPVNAQNTALVDEIKRLYAEKSRIEKEIYGAKARLTKAEIPAELTVA